MAQGIKTGAAGAVRAQAPSEMPALRKETDKKKKKSRKGLIGLIFLVFLLFAAAAFIYLTLTFNFWGLRTSLIDAVNSLDPDYVDFKERLEDVSRREIELTAAQSAREKEDQRLKDLKRELELYESELDDRAESGVPIYRGPLNDEDLRNMKSISKTYAQMEPSTAAELISRLPSLEDRAAIIYYMSEASAAAILAAMDADLAAQITKALLLE